MEGTRIPKKVFKAKFGWDAQEKMGRCGTTGCCQIYVLSQLEAGC
jgi:hypothetical protein